MSEEKLNVQSIQSAISQKGANWRAGDTPISRLPANERVKRLGVKPPPGTPTVEEIAQRTESGELQAMALAEEGIQAPAAFDWRNVSGQNFVTSVKDQGGCGSCVAFGTTAAVESKFRIQRSNAAMPIDLSEASLFYCIGRAEGVLCNTGWWPELAFNGYQNIGVPDEACYPYVAGDQNCTGRCSDWASRVVKTTGQTVLTSNIGAIKDWISTKGPVSACFLVYTDFYAYTSGVYQHVSGGLEGGHCVVLVGYNDSQQCWIGKNSWGAGWGESGFFRIKYGDSSIDTWDVRGVNGILETGWLNNKKVQGLWTIDQTRNAWAYIQDTGWKRVAFDNDNIFFDLLNLLVTAKSANRPVNVYQDQGVIKQIYVL